MSSKHNGTFRPKKKCLMNTRWKLVILKRKQVFVSYAWVLIHWMAVNSVIGTEFLKARSTPWWMGLYLSRGPRCGKHMASTLECQWFYDTPLWAYRVVRLKSALLGCWSFDMHWLSSALSFEMLEHQMAATVHAATWCLRQLTTSQHKPSWNASLSTFADLRRTPPMIL